MTCRQLQRSLLCLVVGEPIGRRIETVLAEHFHTCPDCQNTLRDFMAVDAILKACRQDRMPAEVASCDAQPTPDIGR